MSEKDFLNLLKREALARIYNFLDMYNINSEAFYFLNKVKVVSSKISDLGSYNTLTNVIEVNENMIKKGTAAYNNKTLDEDVYELMISTLVHEYLHANRVVYLNDTASIAAFESALNNRGNKHNISKYNEYLEEISSFIGLGEFDNFIPVKISVNKNMRCDVIAYDKKNKRYLEYINLDYSKVKSSDYKEFLKKLSDMLNNVKKYKFIKESETKFFFSTPDVYITDYEIPEITNIDDEDKVLDYIDNRTQRQETLEEAFTEGLARIITKNPSRDELEDVIDEVSRDDDVNEDVLYALRMMEIGSEDLIPWFLMSAHEEVYEDKFHEFAGENYEEFLLLLDNICYGSTENNRKYLNDLMRLDNMFNEIEQRKR